MTHALISLPDVTSVETDRPSPVQHLYAHIPFCPTKCNYCAFVTHIGGDSLIAPYVAALTREATAWAGRWRGDALDTIYLGGGTPSMLSPQQIQHLLSTFRECFGTAPGAEISMEAHPVTLNEDSLAGYLRAGVNRISFGIESVAATELRALGRPTGDGTPLAALQNAKNTGFSSVAADLMYGIPRQTVASWEETLYQVVLFRPDHLSLYPLSIEPGTVFHRRRKRRDLVVPSDARVVEMYHLACDTLSAAGYNHYEVGSWCLEGHQSRHNLAYWHNRPYIGLGVGAHGYMNSQRTVNVRGTAQYIHTLEAGLAPTLEAEETPPLVRRQETIMLNLRLLTEGLDMDQLHLEHGWNLRVERQAELAYLSAAGLIRIAGARVSLTERAVPVANEVWERLAF